MINAHSIISSRCQTTTGVSYSPEALPDQYLSKVYANVWFIAGNSDLLKSVL